MALARTGDIEHSPPGRVSEERGGRSAIEQFPRALRRFVQSASIVEGAGEEMGIANECVRRWMKQCNATLHRERPVGGGGRPGGGGRDQISRGQISISRHDLLAEWAPLCLPWGLPAIPGRASPVLRGLSQLAQVRLAISVVFPPASARPTPDPRLDLAAHRHVSLPLLAHPRLPLVGMQRQGPRKSRRKSAKALFLAGIRRKGLDKRCRLGLHVTHWTVVACQLSYTPTPRTR